MRLHHYNPSRGEHGACAGCGSVGPLVETTDGWKIHWVCTDCAG